MAPADERLNPKAWGAQEEKLATVGNAVLPLWNQERKGIVSCLRYGDEARIYRRDGDWSLIAAEHDGYLGWAHGLRVVAHVAFDRKRVSNLATHIYPEANMKAPALARLSLGSWVNAHEVEGNFVRIDEGFVFAQHIESAGDAVDYAMNFLNVPYLWGGGSCDGIDCSGLVQLAYMMVDMNLPRDSDQQEASFSRVTREDARRGDLVFWQGHVGILRDTDTMIHATAFAMKTIEENLDHAISRIGPPTSFRRVL